MAYGCILIVNDQAAVRSALAEVLRANGYRVLTATTYQEALEVVEVVAFDLLLVDLSRSAIDSRVLARTLEARGVPTLTGVGIFESERVGQGL